MRALIDTNVFISACLGKGASADVISICIRNEARSVMGASLYLEYEDVLSRDRLFESARLRAGERQSLFDIFVSKSEWCPVYFRWRPNLRDEADNHLIELAIAGNANLIVTNNIRDFKRPDLRFDHLSIVTPEKFLQEMRK